MANESVTEQDEREFDALLSREDIAKLEDVARSFNASRRIVALTLTRSKAQLLEGFDSDKARALLGMHEHVTNYIEHLRSLDEMATTALLRILVVLEDAERLHPDVYGEAAA